MKKLNRWINERLSKNRFQLSFLFYILLSSQLLMPDAKAVLPSADMPSGDPLLVSRLGNNNLDVAVNPRDPCDLYPFAFPELHLQDVQEIWNRESSIRSLFSSRYMVMILATKKYTPCIGIRSYARRGVGMEATIKRLKLVYGERTDEEVQKLLEDFSQRLLSNNTNIVDILSDSPLEKRDIVTALFIIYGMTDLENRINEKLNDKQLILILKVLLSKLEAIIHNPLGRMLATFGDDVMLEPQEQSIDSLLDAMESFIESAVKLANNKIEDIDAICHHHFKDDSGIEEEIRSILTALDLGMLLTVANNDSHIVQLHKKVQKMAVLFKELWLEQKQAMQADQKTGLDEDMIKNMVQKKLYSIVGLYRVLTNLSLMSQTKIPDSLKTNIKNLHQYMISMLEKLAMSSDAYLKKLKNQTSELSIDEFEDKINEINNGSGDRNDLIELYVILNFDILQSINDSLDTTLVDRMMNLFVDDFPKMKQDFYEYAYDSDKEASAEE